MCIDWRLAAYILGSVWAFPLRAQSPAYFMPAHHTARTRMPHPDVLRDPALLDSMTGRSGSGGLSFDQTGTSPVARREWMKLDLSNLSKIGPLNVERATQSPLMEEKGVTTTFAYPLKSLPGVDLTASFFGGHRDTIQGAAGGSAAVTAGIRVHW
ncbi:MAG: hypothetical protein ABF572_03205 [Gluconobacter sp.]|uniref:hypothetical protein n=1 Tax=Gluconobacter sp. TaxID=1876758 RepID=UPI0039EB32AC